MRIIRDLKNLPSRYKGAVVALGNFDGVHLGHQAILFRCREIAGNANAPATVMSFEPHPREFFNPEKARLRLDPLRRKAELMRDIGIDAMFLLRFNKAFSSLTADQFVEEVLHKQMKVKHVVTGYNFAFGKDRKGNTEFLAKKAEDLGFGFSACPPIMDAQGNAISSSEIRKLLSEGEVTKASLLLGHPYSIVGRVQHGSKRGRALGYPTANIGIGRLFKPRFGIYAVRLLVQGRWYDGVASLGVRPTYGENEPVLEVHAFTGAIDLYGKPVQVEFVSFLRDEKRFDNEDLLKSQIEADCAQAMQILQKEHTRRSGAL